MRPENTTPPKPGRLRLKRRLRSTIAIVRAARRFRILAILAVIAGILAAAVPEARAASTELLNVSYDPTRELYRAVNDAFIQKYKQETGADLTVRQSHGGSGSQARAVIDGLEADVVTLALWPDTNAIAKAGLMPLGWEKNLPNDSLPYTSTIVFVVRKGNPKGIKDWPDIVKPGVEIVTPNPKTSGNGKLAFLAAWGSVVTRGGSDDDALAFVKRLYEQTPVLDTGARAATTTFVQKKIGDVHLSWENEALLEVKEAGDEVQIVYPPTSFLAEPHVAVVTKNAERHGTLDASKAYLEFLYTPAGQEIIARNYYRPTNADAFAKYGSQFPPLTLFKIDAVAKSWDDATAKFFADGAIFDRLYKPKN